MNITISILYSLAVFSFLLCTYYFLGYRTQKKEWNQKVREWYPEGNRKSFLSSLGDRFDEQTVGKQLEQKLLNANVKLLPSEYLAILILGVLTISVFSYSVFSIPIMIGFFIAFISITVTHFLLFYLRKNNYEMRFNEQLSDVCRLLANAAKSGMTVNQGIELVAREIPAPAGDEFNRISNELNLGVPLDLALHSVQKRNKSRDFNLFVATILIQKKTGGNLARTLETMSETFEDRKLLNQAIKTITAEQKYISFIVPALPVFLLLMMNNVMDGFIEPLFNGVGLIILVLFLVAIVLSFLLIRKITNIKV